jgi:hypothetical protein
LAARLQLRLLAAMAPLPAAAAQQQQQQQQITRCIVLAIIAPS